MSSLNCDIDTATGIFKQVVQQVAKDRQQLEEDRKKCEEEKQKWEEEKTKINKTFVFHGQVIDLNVGGTRYSTSLSTLTKYPESMLGVMFSGRHDLETMKCNDGSFFIDRDGTHFRHVLNYLRDGEEVVDSFPRSVEVLLGFLREAKYYQLDGLVTALGSLLREVDTITQNDIVTNFKPFSNQYSVDGGSNVYHGGRHGYGAMFNVNSHSVQAVVYKHKNMRGLSFNAIRFDHPLSLVSCDLTGASFMSCSFGSDVAFVDCVLDDTKFSNINGLVTNSHSVSFTGSKTDKAKFDANLQAALQSAKKI
ncbi:uncharacterized protein [Dysidea avara]|uniref:uncharacterized protein n=1 Tax=Dysidea avara TaxID=196820 RepID=UPI003322D57C